MDDTLALGAGKLASRASRLLNRGSGNTIAGKVARKIDPALLKKLASQVENIYFITGTNGKTTTSNLLSNVFCEEGIGHLNNREGDNLYPGILSTFMKKASLNGKIKKKWALLEVDEATLINVLKEIKPKGIIINNFFRDQLDRYGEIDLLIDNLKKAIKETDATLFLNGDDPFTMRFDALPNDKVYFGLKERVFPFKDYKQSESKHCPYCGEILRYETVHYGQLGHFRCSCGFERPTIDVEVMEIKQEDGIKFRIKETWYMLNMPGVYNVYNALGAIALCQTLNIDKTSIQKGIEGYVSKNGRMQSWDVRGFKKMVNLVKNPAGLNITLSEVATSKEACKSVVFFLNDNELDGRDISWIWDADFEGLSDTSLSRVIVSGIRAYDLAIRLKYAGIDEKKITIIESKEKAIDHALKLENETYFLPNYTALAPVRNYINERLG